MQGSLQQVKNSHGELVWRAQWRENGRGRTRILGTVAQMGRAQARAALDAIVKPLTANRPGRTTAITVTAFVKDEYLTSCSAIWKISTERTTSALIQRHILSTIGDRLLAAVTRRDLQELLNALAETLSKSVVSHTRFQLRAIFTMAAGDGAITINPTDGLKLPKRGTKRVAPEIGDRDKIAKAIMSLDARDRLFVALCAWRGMRPGEVCALKVGDIRDGLIHVERRLYMGVIDVPKSDRSTRKVPVESLQEQIDFYVATLPDSSPAAWLFPSETGETPISPKNLYQRRLQPAFEAAGLTRFNYQAMRATFATHYRESEPDAKVRADTMGHTVDVHEQVYRQSTEEQRKRSIRKLDEDRLQ